MAVHLGHVCLGESCLKKELPWQHDLCLHIVSQVRLLPHCVIQMQNLWLCVYLCVSSYFICVLSLSLCFYCIAFALQMFRIQMRRGENSKEIQSDKWIFFMYIRLNVILLRQIPCVMCMSLSGFVVERSVGAHKKGRLVNAHPRLCKISPNYADFATIRRLVATTESSLLISCASLSYGTSIENMKLWYYYAL